MAGSLADLAHEVALKRLNKARKLADVIMYQMGYGAEEASCASQADWDGLATLAKVNPPSDETKVIVQLLLEDRQEAVKWSQYKAKTAPRKRGGNKIKLRGFGD